MVIDRKSGAVPPTAAERMAEHDRRMGVEAIRPVLPTPASADAPRPAKAPPPARRPASPPKPRPQKAARDERARNRPAARPTGDKARRGDDERPAPKTDDRDGVEGAAPSPWGAAAATPQRPAAPPARIAERAKTPSGKRKTIVTGQWWDAKGPRTIELGERGQQSLSGGLMSLFFGLLFASIILFWISPLVFVGLALIGARYSRNIIGTVGAGIIDRAAAERG